ncbi:hypothetical protein MLD38_038703 [Melastoma candidum]|uniref:Uncharacterized protein n=1 Tax=Melastoma candidum TaxID=119954 RepID=A0ACB9L0Z1_9MYRT|nr:hypothetical protein MLD38_038703 [Melastoma candidum]
MKPVYSYTRTRPPFPHSTNDDAAFARPQSDLDSDRDHSFLTRRGIFLRTWGMVFSWPNIGDLDSGRLAISR